MPRPTEALTGDVVVLTHFLVEMGGKVTGYFTEVSGLNIEVDIVQHKIMTQQGEPMTRKMPGRTKAGQVTLKRGVTQNKDVWDWRKLVEQGKIADARTNGTITAYDADLSTIVAQWDIEAAWPSKVSATSLDAGGNEVVMEEMTIVYERIERTQ